MISHAVIADAAKFRRAFQAAQPFKHVCIDDFFVSAAAEASLRDFPPFDRECARNEFGEYGGKAVINNIHEISPFYATLYDYLMSSEFLTAMSAITGIDDLRGDPTLYGGGTHENINGQELDCHVDFNFQIEGGFHRRANLLVYLNREWDPAWGGAIELHSNPRRPEADEFGQFNVIFNRAVIFETNEYSWHGFRKIQLPTDRLHLTRKCLSIYLYTASRPAEEIAGPHSTFYVQWPLPGKFATGRVLSNGDVEELRVGYARRDQQIEAYQRMEERLCRELSQIGPGTQVPKDVLDTAKDSAELVIDFGDGGNSRQYCRDGWASPEELHTWAIGSFSGLELPRPSVVGTYVMAFEVSPYRWPNMPGQRLTVLVNGSEVGDFLLREVGPIECVIPWSVLAARETASVVFRHPDAVRPSKVTDSRDDRELSVVFERLYLFRLFENNERSSHGFRKLRLDASRKCPSIYLYTAGPPAEDAVGPHGAFFVQWPFPEKFAAGRTLSDSDLEELRLGYTRRDRQIELYQHMEERLGRERERIHMARRAIVRG